MTIRSSVAQQPGPTIPRRPDHLDAAFAEVERLLFTCETADHFDRADALLDQIAETSDQPATLARVYGQRSHAAVLRYDYAEGLERLATAATAVQLARRGLELDPNCLEANAWGAAAMRAHGPEMGFAGIGYYLPAILDLAGNALRDDESYAGALAHQILADCYRLSLPAPIGHRDHPAAMRHLLRARELAPDCPAAKLRLAELYLSMRKPELNALAGQQLDLVLHQQIDERGPVFADRCRAKARQLQARLA